MDRERVLFVCGENSARSQMAEAFFNHIAERWRAESAGTNPASEVKPLAVKAMAEAGVDISGHTSKTVSDLAGKDFDIVVTVCGHAHETCPVFPGRAKVVHHGFDDPPKLAKGAATEEEALVHYRRVRDEIKQYIVTLPGSLSEEKNRADESGSGFVIAT